jgi:cysteine desulfurase/selenocysteine lyase
VQHFINAREDREVIFTSGTTDSINLVMHGYGRKFIGAGDEIILTMLEHHSNIVPWQMLAEEKGARI